MLIFEQKLREQIKESRCDLDAEFALISPISNKTAFDLTAHHTQHKAPAAVSDLLMRFTPHL